MEHRHRLFCAVALILLFLGTNTASAEVSVGIKKDDWIEYQVFPTGASSEGHNVTWARLEILDVQGTEISVNITTKASNGTFVSDVENFNPAEGRVGIWFMIPANLNPGESFFDANMGRNVTVEGSQERIIAGQTRTVTYAKTTDRIKRWDKATGVFVETIDVTPNETLYAIAEKTNMWSGQAIGVDPLIFYSSILGVLAAVIIVAVGVSVSRRKMTRRDCKTTSPAKLEV